MRLVSFLRPDGTASFGRLEGTKVVDLGAPAGGSLRLALAGGGSFTDAGEARDLGSVTLLPVIPDPAKILCIGLNFATHVKETGREQKEYPAVFTRWADTLVAHGQPLVRPNLSDRFDYEGEVAVIIGKGGRRGIGVRRCTVAAATAATATGSASATSPPSTAMAVSAASAAAPLTRTGAPSAVATYTTAGTTVCRTTRAMVAAFSTPFCRLRTTACGSSNGAISVQAAVLMVSIATLVLLYTRIFGTEDLA